MEHSMPAPSYLLSTTTRYFPGRCANPVIGDSSVACSLDVQRVSIDRECGLSVDYHMPAWMAGRAASIQTLDASIPVIILPGQATSAPPSRHAPRLLRLYRKAVPPLMLIENSSGAGETPPRLEKPCSSDQLRTLPSGTQTAGGFAQQQRVISISTPLLYNAIIPC